MARPWYLRRVTLRVEILLLITSIAISASSNTVFWRALLTERDMALPANWLVAAAMFVLITCLHFIILALVSNRWTLKPVLAVLLIANAFAVYFINQYTVYLDPTMLRNVLRTDVAETADLLSFGMLEHLFFYAVLPLLFLSRVDIVKLPILLALLIRIGILGFAFLLGAAALLSEFQDLSATMRNQRAMRYLITPANFLYSGFRVLTAEAEVASRPLAAVGEDAAQIFAPGVVRRPRVLVLVVGETARAANWGLSGYTRQTTAELAKLDVINFTNTTSCGTNTEVSVPCMFSQIGRRDYDESQIRSSESLLHVLKHAEVRSVWIDNQSGCKGVCANLEFIRATLPPESSDVARLCPGGQCFDEVLADSIRPLLSSNPRDLVIVLHQMGNHGPAYFKRYPAGFEQFAPVCKNVELGKCTQQEIVNAYDNALSYTDYVLAQTIALLKLQTSHDAGMIYVSDHGESLGENNLYLHGVPFSIAPRVQTHVPMVMWFSPGFVEANRIKLDCLRERAKLASSHDNLFHTTLGLLDIRSAVYEPALDLVAECR
ncbi:MAG: phosphoethanolamine--lipid A transferase [Rhodocyclaceae bacterium]|nr:phosphoethanolamine--lipid A transferase [Rhodocyclaceae bacterium]